RGEAGRRELAVGARRRAAVALAREDEAGKAVPLAKRARELAPHRDRPQAFVEEDDGGRRFVARGADPLVFERYLAPLCRSKRSEGSRRLRAAVHVGTFASLRVTALGRRRRALALAQAEALGAAGRGL